MELLVQGITICYRYQKWVEVCFDSILQMSNYYSFIPSIIFKWWGFSRLVKLLSVRAWLMVILSLLLSFFRLEMEGAQLSIISTNASDSQFIIQIGGVVDKL